MRRFIVATTLAAALAPLAAPPASAASGIVTLRTHQLSCRITSGFRHLIVLNNTSQTIPSGTKISVTYLVDRPVKIAQPYTIVATRNIQPNTSQTVKPGPSGARSCKATVQLPPDAMRR